MRIGIFETDHFEVAYTLIRLFDLPCHQLTVFSYTSSWHQLQMRQDIKTQSIDWVVRKENRSKAAFIFQIYRHIKKERIEMLYLETVTDNFIFYAWLVKALPEVKVVLTIHDINSHFHFKYNGQFRRWLRNTGKKKLIEAVKEFSVINSPMQSYLQKMLPPGKTVRYLPGAFFDDSSAGREKPMNLPIRMVVPGSVDVRRRNYSDIFQLLETCRSLDLPIEITLLGGIHPVYGAAVLQQCQAYAERYQNLKWFPEPVVDTPDFLKEMQHAHFILAPCVIRTVISDEVEEVYGQSMSSGNIGDIIQFALPAIVPETLQTGKDINQVVIRYSSINEIAEQLQLLRDHPEEYLILQQQALQASREFTLEKIRAKHADLFMVNC